MAEDTKEACVEEALRIIEREGVENLSLRGVARNLKISHQAPYKHFASKDHILAEIIARGFRKFADYLEKRLKTGDPRQNMRNLGEAYLKFARDYPLYYRLMFASPHPDEAEHEEMASLSASTFNVLKDRVRELADSELSPARRKEFDVDGEALFVWSTMHGLAMILNWDHREQLPLDSRNWKMHVEHIFKRIGDALLHP